jgi:hypothetical protein
MKYYFMTTVMCFLLVGCSPETPKPFNEGGYQQQNQDRKDLLPENAQVVQDLGNNWIVFKTTVFGEERYFIYNTQGDFSGETSWAYKAVSELRPPISRNKQE